MSRVFRFYPILLITLLPVVIGNEQSFIRFQEQIPTCKDSDGVEGECVKVDQCKHVKDILTSGKFDVSMRNYLIRTQCGFEEKTAKVCCTKDDPSERLSRKPATKKPKTDSSAPIDKPKWLKKLERVFPSPPICGTQKIDIEDKIFGGNRTKIDEYPWIVPLFFTKNHGKGVTNNCGGSLLSKRYVLSAAHCMLFPTKQKRQFVNVKLKFVRLGEWSLETPEDCGLSLSGNEVCAPPHLDIPALKNITHENYSADNISQYNDIALIEMSTDEAYTFEYSDFIKPICLPLNPDLWSASYENELFDVAGWGTTENGKMSQYKLKVTLPYFDREVFNERLKRLGEKARVLDKQFCAGGEKGKDSCAGDSGSGVMLPSYTESDEEYYSYLAGVVSYGAGCGTKGMPGVYTKVTSYLNWISENVDDELDH